MIKVSEKCFLKNIELYMNKIVEADEDVMIVRDNGKNIVLLSEEQLLKWGKEIKKVYGYKQIIREKTNYR